mmetsp:Transcript_26316/g.62491  ORF Transcript_26316/g.62491 Transcript_26316/m.62491 type:complete len:373 (-) Transcript_26316:724-1842(-)
MRLERTDGVVGKGRHGPAHLGGEAAREGVRQQHGVAQALAQRRNLDNDLGEAVVQVFAEAAVCDAGLQVLVGGPNDAHIDRDFLTPTDALDDPLLQEAQQLGLQRHRQIADLVEHQRATVRSLDLAERRLVGPREGALFVAKQLAFQQGLGDGGAVDRDKPALALGRIMQGLGEHLLARAALAEQQHGRVAGRHLFDHPADALHAGVACDQPREHVAALLHLQAPVLLLQLVEPVGAFDGQRQHVGIDGLGEKVVGAHPDRAQGIALVVLAGQHDDLHGRVQLEQLLQAFETFGDRVAIGRQPEVHRDHRRAVAAELQHRAGDIIGRDGLEAVQRPLELLLQRQIVLDDQQGRVTWRAHRDASAASPASACA